jgi:zinc/manganese transport system permease protein
MDILFSAFLLSIVLVGIHAYFGLEIVRRGIIFTDLAVGQMAALGAAISLFFFEGRFVYLLSLLLALSAAGGITLVSRQERRIPDNPPHSTEVFIGLLYALGISGVFILFSKSPHGMGDFNRFMASDLLFTPFRDVWQTALLYALIGLLLYGNHRYNKEHWRDLVFFLLFALTVTSSVRLAGVLVVFSLLVAPALISLVFRARHPLLLAWTYGTGVNLVAVFASYKLDLPTGYTLVFLHALAAVFSFFWRKKVE